MIIIFNDASDIYLHHKVFKSKIIDNTENIIENQPKAELLTNIERLQTS